MELVVVILVMALLAAVGVIAFNQISSNARVAAAKAELTTVAKAAVAELTMREASAFDAVWVTPLYAEVIAEVDAGETAGGAFAPLGPDTPLTAAGQYGLAFKDLTGQINAAQGVGVTFATWVDGAVVSVSASAAGTLTDHEADNTTAWAGEALNGAVQQRVNLATNPSFEKSGATTIRTNLAITPRITHGYTWDGETLHGVPVGRKNSATTTIATYPTTAWVQGLGATTGRITVQPGETYTATYAASLKYVSGEKDTDGRVDASPYVRFYATAGVEHVSQASSATATLDVTTGDWALVTRTFTVPDGIVEMEVSLEFHNWQIAAPAPEEGLRVVTDRRVTGALIEKGTQTYASIEDFAKAYFDGSYSSDPDLTPSWTGAVNASASELRGGGYHLSVWNTVRFRSAQWSSSGQYSMLIRSTRSEGTDAQVHLDRGSLFVPGHTYRVSAVARIEEAFPAYQARRGLILGYSPDPSTVWEGYKEKVAALPNTPGEHRLAFTVTLPDDTQSIVLYFQYHGTSADSDVWLDDLLVEDITDSKPDDDSYFDGDTPSTARSQYRWTGAPHGSTSTALVW